MRTLLPLIALLLALPASAVTIDFESVGGSACLTLVGPEVVTQGFRFSVPQVGSNLFACDHGFGTRALAMRGVIIAEGSGSPFVMTSLDLAERFAGFGAVNIRLTATLLGGGQFSINLTLDDEQGFETYFLPASLPPLVQVQLANTVVPINVNSTFFVDNVVVQVVPEPTTALLVAMGLALMVRRSAI